MNNVFRIVFSLSLSASVLILSLFLLKPFVKNKISKQWQYYIWLIVIGRLLLPFALKDSLINNIFETINNAYYGEERQVTEVYTDNDNDSKVLSNDNEELFKSFNSTEKSSSEHPIQEAFWLLVENIWLVWLGVALAIIIKKITIYKSFVKFIRAGMIPVSNMELLDKVAIIGNQIGVRIACELCENPIVSTPLLIGFFRPCIVIPTTQIPDKNLHYIILHEIMHYKKRDMFYKWLVQIVICIHWFNPLVYLMRNEINKSCEFSCDEAVIKIAGLDAIHDYGNTLLEAMSIVGQYKETQASLTLNENKKNLKERIEAIVNFKKKSRMALVMTIVGTFVLLVGAVTVGAYTKQEKVDVIAPEHKSLLFDLDESSTEQIPITAFINAGGIEIIQHPLDKIEVDYDPQYYDVKFIKENGEWIATITGMRSRMGAHYVKLYIPSIPCNINTNVICGSLFYNLPENSENSLYIMPKDSSIKLSSANQYKNYDISVVATKEDFMEDSHINYPHYFHKENNRLYYKNGTGLYKINVELNGYTNIDF